MTARRPWLLLAGGLASVIPFVPVRADAVVGGDEADPGEWPWQVALFEDGFFLCGGSLVAVDLVVTAAHCTEGLDADDLSVVAGSVSLDDGVERAVAAVEQHEAYNPGTSRNDLSLLVLDEPFDRGDGIEPIALATAAESEAFTRAGASLVVTGFGATSEDGDASPVLLEAEIDAYADNACADRYAEDGDDIFGPSQVCAGVDAGLVDACYGDSGGPLVAPVDGTRSSWVLVGVVSWGAGCGRPRRPTVYTEIAAFSDWIADHVPGERFTGAGVSVPGWGATRGKASDYPVTLRVQGVVGEVTSVAVELDGLDHERPSDLDIQLRSPSGTVVSVPTDGGVLTGFEGDRASGEWALLVADRVDGESGTLDGWTLVLG